MALNFDYNINAEASKEIFDKSCKKIEEKYSNIKKENLLMDVDGSLCQVYFLDGKEIRVQNDYLVGALYVESDVDLSELFGKKYL